jgi:hypothetical protein
MPRRVPRPRQPIECPATSLPQLCGPREHRLRLGMDDGGTTFGVRIWRGQLGPVVELVELTENAGLPVAAVFPQAAGLVGTLLDGTGEVNWVEYWPQRALATLLLGRELVPARHVREELSEGWWTRRPLPLESFRAMIR